MLSTCSSLLLPQRKIIPRTLDDHERHCDQLCRKPCYSSRATPCGGHRQTRALTSLRIRAGAAELTGGHHSLNVATTVGVNLCNQSGRSMLYLISPAKVAQQQMFNILLFLTAENTELQGCCKFLRGTSLSEVHSRFWRASQTNIFYLFISRGTSQLIDEDFLFRQ